MKLLLTTCQTKRQRESQIKPRIQLNFSGVVEVVADSFLPLCIFPYSLL